jgi:hypothetical protein
MKIMNINGMNVQGRKKKMNNVIKRLNLFDINRWIRYEEDYDFEIERWQGLFDN